MTNPNNEEIFPIVNEQGEVIGRETRNYCHSGAKPLHPVVHLHILNPKGGTIPAKKGDEQRYTTRQMGYRRRRTHPLRRICRGGPYQGGETRS